MFEIRQSQLKRLFGREDLYDRKEKTSHAPSESFPLGFSDIMLSSRSSGIYVIFLHEITHNNHDTWPFSRDRYSAQKLYKESVYGAIHVLNFGYDPGDINTLESIVHPGRLKQQAESLIFQVTKLQCLRSNYLPMIFVAHGYGGLICEQAIVLSQGGSDKHQKHFASFTSGIIMFGTPSFGAGLAEWALLVANAYDIKTEKSTQEQDWKPHKDAFKRIAEMQRAFCDINPALDEDNKVGERIEVVCCYETLPTIDTNLILSPQWSFLPGHKVVRIPADHFNMTKHLNASKADEYVLRLIFQHLERRPNMKRFLNQHDAWDILLDSRPSAQHAGGNMIEVQSPMPVDDVRAIAPLSLKRRNWRGQESFHRLHEASFSTSNLQCEMGSGVFADGDGNLHPWSNILGKLDQGKIADQLLGPQKHREENLRYHSLTDGSRLSREHLEMLEEFVHFRNTGNTHEESKPASGEVKEMSGQPQHPYNFRRLTKMIWEPTAEHLKAVKEVAALESWKGCYVVVEVLLVQEKDVGPASAFAIKYRRIP